jgi:predicted phage tail protein
MLTEIKLYGHLKEATGSSSFKAKVSNTAEAVRFLVSNFPTLEHEMANQYYRVSVNNIDIDKTELYNPIGISEIKIVPVVAGSGRGLGKILLGAALIGLAFLIPATVPYAPLKFGGGALFTGGTAITKGLAYIGAALVLSGVSDLFTPQVQPEAEDPLSASFSNSVNTTLATVPIPILYGEHFVGSVVISGGIETADGSPSTSGSKIVQTHRNNNISVRIDPDTQQAEETYDRTNADTSLRRYVRVYSVNVTVLNQTFNRVKIEAVDGDTTVQGTGFTINGDELVTSFKTQNKNQRNFNIRIRGAFTTASYFPGTLRETIGTPTEEGRPAAGSDNGYYYALIKGTVKRRGQ